MGQQENRLGGAGSVAAMLATLDADVTLASITGCDIEGRMVRELLDGFGVDTSTVVVEAERATTVKERLLGRTHSRNPQQIIRVDREHDSAVSEEVAAALLDSIEQALEGCDLVLISDYGKGVCAGEMIPRVIRLAQAAGDFASGKEIAPINSRGISSGILICFEIIFPELSRIQTKNGADIIVNLTNDAWFSMTSAPYQHLGMVVFRAVENKRPLIRSANTGFSAFISPVGKIERRSELFMSEVLKQEVILDSSYLTFYTKYGDLFAILISAMSLIYVIYILFYKKFKEK